MLEDFTHSKISLVELYVKHECANMFILAEIVASGSIFVFSVER